MKIRSAARPGPSRPRMGPHGRLPQPDEATQYANPSHRNRGNRAATPTGALSHGPNRPAGSPARQRLVTPALFSIASNPAIPEPRHLTPWRSRPPPCRMAAANRVPKTGLCDSRRPLPADVGSGLSR